MTTHEKQTKVVFAYCPNCWIHTYHVDEPKGRLCLNCKTLRDMKTVIPVATKKEIVNQLGQS